MRDQQGYDVFVHGVRTLHKGTLYKTEPGVFQVTEGRSAEGT